MSPSATPPVLQRLTCHPPRPRCAPLALCLIVFVLDLARNGELQTRISRMGSLSIECVRYYAAQIVDALGYMHSKGVIHRYVHPFRIPSFSLTPAIFVLPQGPQT